MAQRKKKLTKKKKHGANRVQEAESDSGDFELAAEVKDDDSVSISTLKHFNQFDWKTANLLVTYFSDYRGTCSPRSALWSAGGIAQW